MAMNENEVAESELGSKLLGLKELQPETVSHSGIGMTDLGDKSQVISRIAEAVLTKQDLPQDDLPDHDDSGAPFDFSSSLSSLTGHPSPNADNKGKVSESPPQGGAGGSSTDLPDDLGSLEKQYEFAQFNQKFLRPDDGATHRTAKPLLSLATWGGGRADGEAAPSPMTGTPEGEATHRTAKPPLSLVPGEGGRATNEVAPCSTPSPRELSLAPDPKGKAEDRGANDTALTDAELLVDIAENFLLNENTQPQKFQRQDDEGNRIPTASTGEREMIGRWQGRLPEGGGQPGAPIPGWEKDGASHGRE